MRTLALLVLMLLTLALAACESSPTTSSGIPAPRPTPTPKPLPTPIPNPGTPTPLRDSYAHGYALHRNGQLSPTYSYTKFGVPTLGRFHATAQRPHLRPRQFPGPTPSPTTETNVGVGGAAFVMGSCVGLRWEGVPGGVTLGRFANRPYAQTWGRDARFPRLAGNDGNQCTGWRGYGVNQLSLVWAILWGDVTLGLFANRPYTRTGGHPHRDALVPVLHGNDGGTPPVPRAPSPSSGLCILAKGGVVETISWRKSMAECCPNAV